MYVLRFNSIEDRDGIIKNGMFFFDKKKKILLVRPWTEDFHINRQLINMGPVSQPRPLV